MNIGLWRSRTAWCGIALLIPASVALAAAGPDLVAAARWIAPADPPDWLLGPFSDGLGLDGGLFYGVLWVAFTAHVMVVLGAPSLPIRTVWRLALALIALFALAPPLLSQDVFSYTAYARMVAEYGLNPYELTPQAVATDPVFRYVGWPDAISAYGPLFTFASYPLGQVSVATAIWLQKALAGLCLVGIAVLVGRMATWRGLNPGRAIAIVTLNPIVLVHVVGGAHNDALMALALSAAVACLLSAREARGGAWLVAAAAVKVSAVFAAPFALLGTLRQGRAGRLLAGAIATALAIGLAALLAFGGAALESIALIDQNQSQTTHYSFPATVARILNLDPDLVRTAAMALFAVATGWLLYRTWAGADWVWAAAWAGFAMLLATGWLLPWYLIWVLPLAAIARDRILTSSILAFTAFQLISRVPL